MRPRVSFFVHDLADNPVGRTIALANALKPLYDIEVLGFLISGDEVYRPYQGLLPYKTIHSGYGLKNILGQVKALASMADGDAIYACKPLLTSLLPASVAAGFPKRRPLFLDVDDDSWGNPRMSDLLRDPFCGLRDSDGWGYTRLLHPLTWRVDGTTVVSSALQKRYGGMRLLHGPDEHEFDPARPDIADPAECRRKYDLPLDRKMALFAGTPRPHKGIPVLVEALQRPECRDWDLVLVSPDVRESDEVRHALQDRCHMLGFRTYTELPAILSACDAVALPQRLVHFALSQVPAKLLDAMSMAKAIVVTRVGDLGDLLGEGERGWVIAPDSASALAKALVEIAADPKEAARRGLKAREWSLKESSGSAICEKLDKMIRPRLK